MNKTILFIALSFFTTLIIAQEHKEYYNDKTLKVEGQYDEGLKTGIWKNYYENGQLKSIGNYESFGGEKNGGWKYYYENGQLKSEGRFLSGFRVSEWKYYHENGSLECNGIYEYGEIKVGEWIYNDDEGVIIKTELWGEGKLIETKNSSEEVEKFSEYYDNRQLKVIGNKKNGLKIGEWKYYNENGQLKVIGTYENGTKNGEWKIYHENGELSVMGKYENGNQTGEWKAYHKNGQLSMIGMYENGYTNGEWKIYHENGQLHQIGMMEKGKENGEFKYYHDNGQLHQIGMWKAGRFMDVIICLDKEGKKLNKGTLVNGNGTVNTYSSSGELISTDTYLEGEKQNE
jgi:antitoxin component YwqK of YwqJK toxin-antitoxin module